MQQNPNGPAGAPGIQVVHSAYCPSRSGGECDAQTQRRERCRASYRASVYDKRTKSMVKRTFSGSGAFQAAKRWRAEAMTKVERGVEIVPFNRTLREAAEDWLTGAKASPPTVLNRSGEPFKPSVLRTYERDLNKYVLPDLGSAQLAQISRKDLRKLKDRLVVKGLSPSKVRNVFNPVRAIYREAEDDVQVNPTTGLRLPKLPKAAVRAVEPTEMTTFLKAMPEDVAALYATAFFAGLRRGELRGLRWSDIEFREGEGALAGYLTVERSVDDVAGIINPKSDAGNRRVPIVRPYLSERLGEARTRTGGEGYVFGPTPTMTFEPTRILRHVEKAVASVNAEREEGQEPIRKLDLHAGRHTFGAMLRWSGVPEADITEYLGHSRPGITARYTSPIEVEARDLDNMTKFAAYLARGDTSARIAQLDSSQLSESVLAAFADDRDGFEQLVRDLRQQLEGGEEA